MSRLRSVWAAAWATLPESVHRDLSARGTRGPNRRVVRVLFATIFGDDEPDDVSLPSELRSPRVVFTDKPVDTHDVERIERAVAARAALLAATADIYAGLRTSARAAGLSGDNVDEHLLRRAYQWAASDTEPTESSVAALLTELQGHPSPSRLRELLDNDPPLVADLERRLADAWLDREPIGTAQPEPTDVRPYLEFLDDEDLDDGAASLVSERRWDQALAVDTSAWHHRTASLGLSATSPHLRPVLRALPRVADASPHEWHIRWLDTSIEERVSSALRRDLRERVGLPAMPELMTTELLRSARPLGLLEPDSRTVLVLGAEVAQRAGILDKDATVRGVPVIGGGVGQVRASTRVRDRFHFWKLEQEESRGVAGFPKVWAGILADPTTFYLSFLWLRLHHDEIYGRPAYTASDARWAVVGIASTVVDRLKSLPASQPQGAAVRGTDDPEARVVDLHAGRAIAIYYEIDRIRAGVDPDEFTRFFLNAGRDPEADERRWREWTSAVRSDLALTDVLDWIEEHGSG